MKDNEQFSLLRTGNGNGLQKKELAYKLGPYFFNEARICNFIITGQGDRAHLLYVPLMAAAGRIPVVILHNQSHELRAEAALVWTDKFGTLEDGHIWFGDDGSFEPFLGMEEEDIIAILVTLAKSMEMTCTPFFSKVVKAHLCILRCMDCELTLSGLYYLCSFDDLEEFQDNILTLNCSEYEKRRILADLGLSGVNIEQFELFRMIIRRLGYEMKSCGWTADSHVGYMNMGMALKCNAMMLLNVNNTQAPLVIRYLSEELRMLNNREFLLILDNIYLEGTPMMSTLYNLGPDIYLGLMGGSVLNMMGSDLQNTQAFCDRIDRIVMLKQKVATTAESLVQLLGTKETERVSRTSGSDRRRFEFLPTSYGKSVTVTKEDRYRIMPEELMHLKERQAIVFDTETNQIIRI